MREPETGFVAIVNDGAEAWARHRVAIFAVTIARWLSSRCRRSER